VTAGAATAAGTQNTLNINQTSNNAVLNWSSFNIAAGNSVNFKQPSSSSIALNKIYQESPSQIFGQLNANGQVYLINLNGFLFGPNSQVNVGSLLVSTLSLNLSDADFSSGKGILTPAQNNNQAAFDATLDPLAQGGRNFVLDANGSPVLDAQGNQIPVQILVQPGAQIAAADQGRILLAGQKVTNGGSLTAPDGQIILAAGAKIYLEASGDSNLRGLVVEVDKDAADGTAWNQLTGALSAPRGNVTMVGLAVNQDGRISATTSVAANGSIRLEASEGASFTGGLNSTHGGTLTIGSQSEMDILPELSSTDTGVKAQAQAQSSITLLGEQVFLQGGSIVAPGGNLTAVAAANPESSAAAPTADPNARLRIDSGVSIDLSGSKATLPVSANLVPVQLRSSELADDPTQRNGVLHGLTVYVDARHLPSSQLANVQSDVDAVPQNVAQRTETGGTAVFQSGGDVVFSSGASINVSGGSTTYTGGVMQSSYLVGANGKLYPIATASPLMSYVGVLNPTFSQTYNKWGVKDVLATPGLSTYEPGYVQGAAGGKVQFAAPSLVLRGSLQGTAVNGIYQRTPSTAVAGGTLIIGVPSGVAGTNPGTPIDYLSPAIQFTRNPTPIVTSDDSPLPNPLPLYLPTSYLTDSGFTSTQIYSNYDVTLPAGAPLNLPSGSTLAVNAARVNVLANITDAGGTLNFQNVYNVGSVSTTSARPGVYIGDGVTLDVGGLWTNDMPMAGGTGVAQTWQNGGQIDLGVVAPGALLSIGDDVALRADGGAWMNAKGSLTGGTGGTIAISSDASNSGLDVGKDLTISAFGVQGAKGGEFDLTAPRIEISAGTGNWTDAQQVDDTLAPGSSFKIYSSLFSNDGFQTFKLHGSGLVAADAVDSTTMSVDPGTDINATVSSLNLPSRLYLTGSAPTIAGLATLTTLPEYSRHAATISLSSLPSTSVGVLGLGQLGKTNAGDVVIGTGASLSTDAGGSISLASLDSIIEDGSLVAPGGSVALRITGPQSADFEAGFLPNQRIEIGPQGLIDVSGTFVSKPTVLSLDLGTVYAGGTVSLVAGRGAVVAERGSLISVAGATAPQDILQANGLYGHELAASAGGSITVDSGQSIFLLGAIQAAAGSGGTSGQAAAGSLFVELTRATGAWQDPQSGQAVPTFNSAPLEVQIQPSQPVIVGLPTPLFNSNEAILGASELAQSGLDSLQLLAGGSISFAGNFSLTLNRSLMLDSPVISSAAGAQASLTAPYVQVGYSITVPANSNVAMPGTGIVHFSGDEIDLYGTTVFQGISDVTFSSSGDLLLRDEAINIPAAMTVAGSLTLDAARIYPTTATTFTLEADEPATGVHGSITIGQTGANPGTPYSAGGSLILTADDITSTGTIYAPFGQIYFKPNNSLTFGDGSLTSVSGGGLTIPYGQTQLNGGEWVGQQVAQIVTAIPNRTVSIDAPAASVTIAKNATIDLSGGGDLFAYEWVPGTGGTKDQLSPNTGGSVPGLYAILPSTRGQAAPQDLLYAQAQTIGTDQSVYLSGGAGLAAGYYPLLPARYALVPGAYLIQVQPSMVSTTAGSLGTLPDGTPVVAGYLSYGSTGLHQTPGYTGFAIYPGSYGNQLAEYDVTTASTFFSAAASLAGKPRPNLPADAGTLSILVGSAFQASGAVDTAAAKGGLAASIEISANDLVVGTATGPVPQDAVTLSSALLASWQPGSLLLGGSSADGSSITVGADSVTIGSGATLTADQIVLVANHSVDVQNGATVRTTSAATGSAPANAPEVKSVTLTDSSGQSGGAAFLAVSDLNWLIPGTELAGATATVAVEAGASVSSRGSLSLEGPGALQLNGTLTGSGAKWSLGTSSIAFVADGARADALSIDSALATQLGTASAVRLASAGAIDVMAPVSIGVDANGNPTLTSLTLSASSLNGPLGAGSGATRFGAQTLVLQGNGSSSPSAAAGPAGSTLSLSAGELDIGPDSLAINGFGSTQISASGAVIGKGSGALNVGGDLSITATGVTADLGANTAITATGALTVAGNGSGVKAPVLLGGAVSLTGGSVDISGSVTAPSGIIKVTSTSGAVSVDSGATLSTAGQVVSIQNQTAASPGGDITINSAGDLSVASGAVLDVSAGGTGAAAGMLSLASSGTASVAGTLKGAGGAGASGGSFSLDAGSLSPGVSNPLTPLVAALSTGGFNDAIEIRARTGDLDLASGSSLAANTVDLTADSGFVTVAGDVSATSGAMRGELFLFGGKGVELQSGGALHADTTGSSGLGGTIEIGAGQLVAGTSGALDSYNNARILLDQGSTISAAGDAGKGTLLLRAPALSNDVAIGSIGSDTSGVGAIVLEPVLVFNTNAMSSATAPTATDLQQVQQTVANYVAAAGGNIAAKVPASNSTPFLIQPGVELVAPGDLTLGDPNTALDLSTWHTPAGAPIDLTVRAAGNINVVGTITDGFGLSPTTGQLMLTSGASSSMRFVSGADLSSANPLSAVNGIGTLTIGAVGSTALIRTGTGDIDLVAGQDVVIAANSGAYTAGTPAQAPNGDWNIPSKYGTTQQEGVYIPRSGNALMSFPMNGGNLTVRAGNDVVGSTDVTDPTSTTGTMDPGVSSWQLREGGNQEALPMWGVNLAKYNWNLGTLGGGDLRVAAGHDALDLMAAAADSLLPEYTGTTQYIRSGGLSLTAGNDIRSAEVFLADGSGTVRAGGALSSKPAPLDSSQTVGTALYMQSSSLDVTARLGMAIDGIFNPTTLGQTYGSTVTAVKGSFVSYSADSAVELQSVAGDISLGSYAAVAKQLLGVPVFSASNLAGALPASLSVQALSGNLQFGPGIGRSGSLVLAPSPNGQLDLLAAQDITGVLSQSIVTMSDAPAGTYASVDFPLGQQFLNNLTLNFAANLHISDTNPAQITAGRDISALQMSIPKAATIVAGRDLIDDVYTGENLNATDLTLIMAGRDFIYDQALGAGNGVTLGGPGALDILAGRNLSLGFSLGGVVTTGNLLNASLPTSQGASITMMTGLATKPDFADFVSSIIAPSTAYQADLINYVQSLEGSSGLTFADAETAFLALTPEQQQPLIDKEFFHELLLSGRAEAANPKVGFAEGYKAIDALFPQSRDPNSEAYSGDLTLDYSRIYTLSGGDINLIVPGGIKGGSPSGKIDVGLANPPASLQNRDASTLGIVAQGTGNVNIYTKGDVNVNASRIFTLGGGDILIWSDLGNIDAGRGAKSAISAPPPTILINPSTGSVSLNFAGAAQGSGIRTIQTNPDQALGSVDLFAPVGIIDAGDAGIGAAGNITLAAAAVHGADNINFGGTSVGVPPEVGNLGAALSGASSAGSSATTSATSSAEAAQRAAEQAGSAPLSQTALSWLDVFVTGLGEENCKPDDLDCMKRQKTNVN
jgi:filamentous hemagglutinin family protein